MTPSSVHRLPASIEAAASRIKQAARAAVERTIESLGLAALSAGSVAQRSELLAAQFELDRKSAVFLLAFNDAFESKLRRDCSPRVEQQTQHSDWSELSLLDDRELENKVAAERFGLQIAHQCEWELRELNAYLGAVLALERVEADSNPLRPELIGAAMIRAAESISDRADVRKTLVAEIGRSLGDALAKTYAAIVAEMRASGLKPAGMTVRTSDARGPDSRLAESVESRAMPGHFGAARGGRGSTSGPGALGGLGGMGTTSTRGGFAGSSGSGTLGGSPYSGSLGQVAPRMMTVIRRLAYVNTGAVTGGGGQWAGEFVDDDGGAPLMAPNMIRAHRDELRDASRGAIDHMVIDVIGSLFDQILSDPKVPPQVARQIARLQLPVLRAALGDPSFFSSRRHPVRRFVNRIASVGAAIDDFDGDRSQRLLARIGELVQEVVEGDFEQIGTFESKLIALEAFVAELSREEVASEHGGAAELLQQKEDQLRLQRLYAAQIESELKNVPAPDFLRSFVSTVWSQVLLRMAARDGADPERVKRLRHTAHELVMSVQPKASPQQRKQFLADLPKLMRQLNEGMDLIAWPDLARRDFFGQLLPAHAEALKNAAVRTLDYNLMAKRVEGALDKAPPSIVELRNTPLADLPVLSDEVLVAPFDATEAALVGLVKETAIDWDGKVDIDLSAEPELTSVDIHIDGLTATADAPEPSRGKSLADHVQIGFAYQMHLQGHWEKVRLSHVSPGRTFYVFTYGNKHKQTASLTHRMLVRLCETNRLRAFENAYLIERATARARKQLAALGGRSRSGAGISVPSPLGPARNLA